MLQIPAADSGAVAGGDRGHVGGNRSRRGDMDHLARAAKRHAFANSSKTGAFAAACDSFIAANPRTAGRSAIGREAEARARRHNSRDQRRRPDIHRRAGRQTSELGPLAEIIVSQDRRIGLVRAYAASHGGDIGGGPWGRAARDFHFARPQERRRAIDGGIQQESLPARTCRGVAAGWGFAGVAGGRTRQYSCSGFCEARLRTAKKITRSPRRGKIARGRRLTPRQKKLASEFISGEINPKDAEAFAEAFDKIWDEIGAKPDEKMSRRLQNEITPAAKRAAIESTRPFKKAALRELRRHGAPDNIRLFIEKLGKNVLARTYVGKVPGVRGERAVRYILSKTFGITGTRGRKPR